MVQILKQKNKDNIIYYPQVFLVESIMHYQVFIYPILAEMKVLKDLIVYGYDF